jgi:hypothetical protein
MLRQFMVIASSYESISASRKEAVDYATQSVILLPLCLVLYATAIVVQIAERCIPIAEHQVSLAPCPSVLG